MEGNKNYIYNYNHIKKIQNLSFYLNFVIIEYLRILLYKKFYIFYVKILYNIFL